MQPRGSFRRSRLCSSPLVCSFRPKSPAEQNNGRDVVTDYLWRAPFFMYDPAVNAHVAENKTTKRAILIYNQTSVWTHKDNIFIFIRICFLDSGSCGCVLIVLAFLRLGCDRRMNRLTRCDSGSGAIPVHHHCRLGLCSSSLRHLYYSKG